MKIVENKITMKELEEMAEGMFGDMVKAAVDIRKRIMAVDDDPNIRKEIIDIVQDLVEP